MKKHAVPQNIMDIEFKLFGSLTMRQFTYLAVTFISALIIYFTFSGISAVIAYPLIIFIVLLGLALAFLTVNDRPFSVWFVSFVTSLFSSQRKVYQKSGTTPAMLKKVYNRKLPTDDSSQQARPKIDKEYLQQKLRNQTAANEVQEASEVDDVFSEEKSKSLDAYFNNYVQENMDKYNISPKPQLPQAPIATQRSEVENLKQSGENIAGSAKANNQELIGGEEKIMLNTANNINTRPLTIREKINPGNQRSVGNNQTNTAELKVIDKLETNQIAGFVTDPMDKGLDKAEVKIKDEQGKILTQVFTDSNGKFILPNVLPDGRYLLEMISPGLVFPEYEVKLEGKPVPMYKYPASELNN